MKAKIIRENHYAPGLLAGEIVEIVPGMETDAEGVWNAPAGKLFLCRKANGTYQYASPRDIQVIADDATTDWQSFRREAAKDILCAMVSGGYGRGRESEHAYLAIKYADELIKHLKQE